MGLHSGAADERDGDYFGPALNRVALIGAAQAWYERTAMIAQVGDIMVETRIADEVRAGLDEAAYARALRTGSQLTLQDAAEIAAGEVGRLGAEGEE